jgi:hypothetical protein
MATPQGILLEANTCFREQLRYQCEVALSADYIDVAKERGKLRQEPLYIRAISIPRNDSMDRSRMTKVVQSWLLTDVIVARDLGNEP